MAEQATNEALGLAGRPCRAVVCDRSRRVTSALRRQAAAGGLTRRQHERALLRFRADRDQWTLIELDLPVLIRAESVAGRAPVRTLDALHLASALVFQTETDLHPPFITGDAQQRRAAEALGLDVAFVG